MVAATAAASAFTTTAAVTPIFVRREARFSQELLRSLLSRRASSMSLLRTHLAGIHAQSEGVQPIRGGQQVHTARHGFARCIKVTVFRSLVLVVREPNLRVSACTSFV